MPRSALFSRLSSLVREAAGHPPGHGIDRRTLLQLAAASTGAGMLTGLPGCGGDGRVAVVGAGLAGMHCAWRLHEAGVDVTVFEASERVGGRTFTGRGLYPEDQICELGGELVDTNHVTMWTLAEELGLTLDDRAVDLGANTVPEVWWVDGVAVPDAQIVEEFKQVAPAIAADFDAAETDDAAFTALNQQSLKDYLLAKVPPDQFKALHSVLDSAYRGEFGLENDQQSALNLIYLIDAVTPDPFRIFGDSDERYHTHEGNDAYCTRMAADLGERVRLQTRLTGAHDAARHRITLVLEGPDGTFEDTFDHVVFALPFSLLRTCDLADLTLTDEKRQIIRELAFGTNAKVMGGFSRRVWKVDHDALGSATTDLSFQQCWSTSIGQAGESGILTDFLGGQAGIACGEGTAEDWFTSVLPDLERVWPGMEAAYTAGSAVRMHWPTAPWSLMSYTCYTPGQWDFWSLEGVREGNAHFCGESCSLDFQGWMEGAAETGGLVAAEILEELGLSTSEAHAKLTAWQTLLPQAGFRATRGQRPAKNPIARRRAWRAAVQALAERHGVV